MKTLLVIDKESMTELAEDLKKGILSALECNQQPTEVVELAKRDAAACLGCLCCLTKHPGECVSKDTVNQLVRNARNYGLTIFITPVIFGHFSSTITNAMSRGAGSHKWQIVIGFAESVDDEEKSTFIDLITKHRGQADIVHPGMDQRVDVFVTTSAGDNAAIFESLNNHTW